MLREGGGFGERGVRTGAIAFGVIADSLSTLLGLAGLGITLSIAAHGASTAASGGLAAELALLLDTPSVGMSLVGINAASAAIGGFTAGAIAGRAHVRHAFLTGCMILAVGMFFAFEAPDELAHWDILGSLALTLPAAVVGGWLSRGRRR